MASIWDRYPETVHKATLDALMDTLSNGRVFLPGADEYGNNRNLEITHENIDKFCKYVSRRVNIAYIRQMVPGLSARVCDAMIDKAKTEASGEEAFPFDPENDEQKNAIRRYMVRFFSDPKYARPVLSYLKQNLSEQQVLDALFTNSYYERATSRLKNALRAEKMLLENIETATPEDYTVLYPLARQMKRHFHLHIGPTNSGKTYQAIEDLMQAQSGVYLAPLRLLAYEQYEKMNREGIPCSMITGEEQILMPGSFHQSSTIEMLNIKEEWDMAVIDEAQMIADTQRGGYWTNAIMGLRSPVIHVCASGDAEEALIRLIGFCGDTYDVEYHERKTPLVMDEEASVFDFPEDVKEGDALIVFSRRDVHSVAAELQNRGISCSIIYGSLPYEVRHREAYKFATGETKAVVATDAIGMGMNLPIRRIIFLQTVKFNGVEERTLTPSEVKQIAGRAGRYGLYDTGYVTSYYDFDLIKTLLNTELQPIKKAMIPIPEDFLSMDGKISSILEIWNRIPASDFYDKGDISEKIKVAKALEEIKDDRDLVRKFIRIPTNPDNKEIFDVFEEYYSLVSRGKEPDLQDTMWRYGADIVDDEAENALQELEISSAVYDFLYAFTRMFGREEDLSDILDGKRKISDKIFVILDRQNLSLKTCIYCGRRLNWAYRYTVCPDCFRNRRRRRY